MKIKLNPDQEIVNTIREGLKRTGVSCPPLLPSTDGNGKCQTLLWIFSSLLRQQAHFGQTSPSLSTTTGMCGLPKMGAKKAANLFRLTACVPL